MTTLVSWVTYDQRGPASLYIASDSRFSWEKRACWDSGRKIHFSNKYPVILGFCGDVMFCSQVISQVISYIDACDIFEKDVNTDTRFDLVFNLIKRSFGDYPVVFALESFQILYATRESRRCFHTYIIKWDKNKSKDQRWSTRKLSIPSQTDLIVTLGSGGRPYRKHYEEIYSKSEIGGLSRSFYSSLSSHIDSGKDPYTGGPIQLASLTNIGGSNALGVIKNNKRYLYGMEIDPHEKINNIRWVNDLFENCDGNDVKRLKQAQVQPLPRNLNNPLGKNTKKIPLPR